MQTYQFSVFVDRTVCRLASSSCITIGRDRRENKLMYCRERGREGEGERKRK